ncbi:unnamed protein product [Didymodactylos carnosus]|uniref:Uncharacterized protein n=1 Tax=Didymodactylos carnosus TaxID=1234261 RepID=A0A814VAR8_9BILA|nr:unnamed protein product [Didymodactylos carnosus]CAF1188520.1 unnamed protein product [Didymodactylos carnosus]CAF3710449.1 unnamed protein product [Didymodactylos carnosus]CAF3952773.1 unnamed protein product [Didymodactylos carnosus]
MPVGPERIRITPADNYHKTQNGIGTYQIQLCKSNVNTQAVKTYFTDVLRVQPTPPCASKSADYVPSVLIENLIQSSKTQPEQSRTLIDNHHDKIKTHVEETVKSIDNHHERIDNHSKQLDKHKNILKFVYPSFHWYW